MISIIVIGKNEGWRITKCFESIERLVDKYKEYDFELIYVDSKSTDDSLDRVKRFKGVRAFSILGETNAAIARNIGAEVSKGEILFFVDGDMEIIPDFLMYALKDGCLIHDVLTGHVDDYFYAENGTFITSAPRTYNKQLPHCPVELIATGGLMMIRRKVWEENSGMRSKYKRSQDLDLCLRLRRKNIRVLQLPHMLAHHHTVSYANQVRMWKNFREGYFFYSAMLVRDHFRLPGYLVRAIMANHGAILLFIALLGFFKSFSWGITFIVFYLIWCTTYVAAKSITERFTTLSPGYLLSRFANKILKDMSFWVGLFFFFPKEKKKKYMSVGR